MLAMLDILQSIPVLSFLPGVMLAMVALFPTRQMGVEFGSIILIFTGQVWNMAFSFYASLQAIPRELREASRVYRFSRLPTFLQLELPYGAIGLVWNSMVSVAGGWFFLMACEMFVLGNRDFRLPGLGSFLQSAAGAGDTAAILWGLAAMIAVIVLIDQCVWRPAIAWSDKFKFEQVESNAAPSSGILNLLRRSPLLARLQKSLLEPMSERIYLQSASRNRRNSVHVRRGISPQSSRAANRSGERFVRDRCLLGLMGYGVIEAFYTLRTLTRADLVVTIEGAGATFLRVAASLIIASAWAIPAGVAIGFHPRLARIGTAAGADRRVRSGNCLVPRYPAGPDQPRRRAWHGIDSAHAARHAVVHSLQRDRRSDCYSFGPEGSRRRFPFQHRCSAGAPCILPGHLSVPDHRSGHGFGRGVECKHRCRILPSQRPRAFYIRAGRAAQRRDGQRATSRYAAAVDDGDGDVRRHA